MATSPISTITSSVAVPVRIEFLLHVLAREEDTSINQALLPLLEEAFIGLDLNHLHQLRPQMLWSPVLMDDSSIQHIHLPLAFHGQLAEVASQLKVNIEAVLLYLITQAVQSLSVRYQGKPSIYFSASIRGGREDEHIYHQLAGHIIKQVIVVDPHVGQKNLLDPETALGLTDRAIYDRDMAWVALASGLIAEVTTPSLGVGMEIDRAVILHKPVLCLYRPQANRSLSAMINGCPYLDVVEYTALDDGLAAIDRFLQTNF